MSNLVLNAGWLGDWFYGIWINLMLLIDNVIYMFINWMYRVFMLVAKVDIFGGGAEIEAITRRIYVIVGIAMLFIFAYNLILLIINPEGKQLGNMAKVVQNAIISIILVTLLPLLFSYLTTIQNHVLESNVIGQIILGTSSDTDMQTKNKTAGVNTALTIFSAFYHPKGETYNSCDDGGSNDLCDEYVTAYKAALDNEDLSLFIWDDDLKDGAKDDKMEYNWIISTAAGVFALWIFVSFALDIGVRVGKMAFYELISPIPVMMRILPNDKMFDKWFKGITSTFISLFVRLIIIYFCMYAINLVPNVLTGMWASNDDNIILLALANVVVILGILQFAKEAPKLISDLFGGSGGDLKFGVRKKLAENPINTPIGMIRSGNYAKKYGKVQKDILDENGNKIGEEEVNTGGWFRGAWRGRGGYEKGVATTDAMIQRRQSGANLGDVVEDKARVAAGLKTAYEEQDFIEKQRLIAAGTEELKESNKELKESIDALEDSIKNAIEKPTSNLTADLGGFGKQDADGNYEYQLTGNLTKMNEILEQAIRDKADASTIDGIRDAIKDWKKNTAQDMRDKAMEGNASSIENVDRDLIHIMENASENIKKHMSEKGISTYDKTSGEWNVKHNITVDDQGHWKIGDLKTELKISDTDISEVEKNIRDEVRNRYKAKKGSSDWVKRNNGSSKGSK